MYAIVIDLALRAEAEEEAVQIFESSFRPAISAQEGFRSVMLLKPAEGLSYLLVIIFENRTLQEKWVATDLHTDIWSAFEQTLETYNVRRLHSI